MKRFNQTSSICKAKKKHCAISGHTSMLRLLYLLCFSLLIQSCIGDDDDDDEDSVASIIAAKTDVRVSAAAGDEEITIQASDTVWTVTEEVDWLEAMKVDNSKLRISYDANPDTEERSGIVTATISDKSVNITVTQETERPVFASDATIAAQTYVQNVTDVMLALPEATGGDGTLTYSITPTLPAGLDFDEMSREISGIPTEVLSPAETFTYTATDTDSDTDMLTFTILVEEAIVLTTTTHEVGARANPSVMITLEGLRFGTGIAEWWITAQDGSPASSVGGIKSVSVNNGSRANTNVTSFTMDVERYAERTPKDLNFAIQVASNTGGTSESSLSFTVRRSARVGNGEIPINTLEQLHAIRYDLTGDGTVDHAGDQTGGTEEENLAAAETIYTAAFPNVIRSSATIYEGYRLENDLDFNDAASYSDPDTNMPKWAKQNPAQTGGWLPIGDGSRLGYTNVFDGRGHKISNLYINRSTGLTAFQVGLFSELSGGNAGFRTLIIRNTGLENPEVTGGSGAVGGLVASLFFADISNCYVSGGTITSGRGVVGGLVGSIGGGNSEITKCYASGVTVSGGTNANAGGLAGSVGGSSIGSSYMIQCYVSGGTTTVGASTGSNFNNNAHAGGLSGDVERGGEIFQCYVFNHTSSGGTNANVGSLVGGHTGGKIHDCYAGGRTYTNIRGTGSGTITDCYYEIASDGTDSGRARKAASLQAPTDYTGIYDNWDVGRVSGADDSWDFGMDSQYPVLKVDFNPVTNSGTADDVMKQRP